MSQTRNNGIASARQDHKGANDAHNNRPRARSHNTQNAQYTQLRKCQGNPENGLTAAFGDKYIIPNSPVGR